MLRRFFQWLGGLIEVCDALAPFLGGWPVIISFLLTGVAVIWGALANMGPGIIPIAMLTLGVSAVATDELLRIAKKIRRRVLEKPALAQRLRDLTAEGISLRDNIETDMHGGITSTWLQSSAKWDRQVRQALSELSPDELHGYESISSSIQAAYNVERLPGGDVAWSHKSMAERVGKLRLVTLRFLKKSKLKAGELFNEEEAKKV